MADGFNRMLDFEAIAPLLADVLVYQYRAIMSPHNEARLNAALSKAERERNFNDLSHGIVCAELNVFGGAIAHMISLNERLLENMERLGMPPAATYDRLLPFKSIIATRPLNERTPMPSAERVCRLFAIMPTQDENGRRDGAGFPRVARYLYGAWFWSMAPR